MGLKRDLQRVCISTGTRPRSSTKRGQLCIEISQPPEMESFLVSMHLAGVCGRSDEVRKFRMRRRTQGRAVSTMQFSHYDGVPNAVQDEIVARVTGR